jgi:hypothetical protein
VTYWWRVVGVGIAGGLILLGSCATEPCACPPVLEVVTVLDGDQQVGAVGQALSGPIVVRVDQQVPSGGGALPGRTVHFLPRPGSGTVSESAVVTDTRGRAQVTWTLGPDPGEDTLVVSLYWPYEPPVPAGEAIVTATGQ